MLSGIAQLMSGSSSMEQPLCDLKRQQSTAQEPSHSPGAEPQPPWLLPGRLCHPKQCLGRAIARRAWEHPAGCSKRQESPSLLPEAVWCHQRVTEHLPRKQVPRSHLQKSHT